jgi:hypothetical protein
MPTTITKLSKKLVVVYGDIKGAVRLSESDSLQEVRALIEAKFDDYMLPSGEFCFQVDGISIARRQEEENLAWDILHDEDAVSLHQMRTKNKRKRESRVEEPTVTKKLRGSERDETTPGQQALPGTTRNSISTENEKSSECAKVNCKKTNAQSRQRKKELCEGDVVPDVQASSSSAVARMPASDYLKDEAKSKSTVSQRLRMSVLNETTPDQQALHGTTRSLREIFGARQVELQEYERTEPAKKERTMRG